MGIHISRTAALAPISAASTVIGFVSFGVTVGTFLRVFWGNIQTVMHARREIPVSALSACVRGCVCIQMLWLFRVSVLWAMKARKARKEYTRETRGL